MISLDIFATAAALARAPLERRKKYDGVNLMPYLTGANPGNPHDQLYWRIGNRAAIRVGDWKLLRNPGRGQPATWQLYNLADDIGEQDDRASRMPGKMEDLQRAWEKMNSEMIEPVWNPRG